MKEDIYKQFLKTMEFSEEEMPKALQEWKAAADHVGLTEKDIDFALNDWIPKYWDISLQGVRMCLGIYIRELIEITKVASYKKGNKKIVYGISPSQAICFNAIKLAGRDDVFVSYPDFLLATVLGAFFDKLLLYCEDDTYFSDRCRHCALNRARINMSLVDIIESPDVIWSWGFYCDEGRKTDELIECLTERTWKFIPGSLPHDAMFGEKEDKDVERVKYLANQLKTGHEEISKIIGIEVKNKHLFDALVQHSKFSKKLNELNKLVTNSNPQPIGGNEMALFGTIAHIAMNIGYKHYEQALDCILEEVKEKIHKKQGILPPNSPKLGCHFTPLNVPWVDRMFLKNGVSLTFSSHISFTKKDFMPFDYGDAYMIAAQIWLRNANSVNLGAHAEMMADMLDEYDIDGMLYGFFSFDRWLGTHQFSLKMIEEKSGVQHFYLEGDYWNDRNYKLEDREGRIESIAYFLRTRKMLKNKTSQTE